MNFTIELLKGLRTKNYVHSLEMLSHMSGNDIAGLDYNTVKALFSIPKKILLDSLIKNNILTKAFPYDAFMKTFLSLYAIEFANDDDFLIFFESAKILLTPTIRTVLLHCLLNCYKQHELSVRLTENRTTEHIDKHLNELLLGELDHKYPLIDYHTRMPSCILHTICENCDFQTAKRMIIENIGKLDNSMIYMIIGTASNVNIVDVILSMNIDLCEENIGELTIKHKSLLQHATYGCIFEKIITDKRFRFSSDYNVVESMPKLFNIMNYKSHFEMNKVQYPVRIFCENKTVIKNFQLYCEKAKYFSIESVFQSGNRILIKNVCRTKNINIDNLFDRIFSPQFEYGVRHIYNGNRLNSHHNSMKPRTEALETVVTKIILKRSDFILTERHVSRIRYYDNEIFELIKSRGFNPLDINSRNVIMSAIVYEDYALIDKVAPFIKYRIMFSINFLSREMADYLKLKNIWIEFSQQN